MKRLPVKAAAIAVGVLVAALAMGQPSSAQDSIAVAPGAQQSLDRGVTVNGHAELRVKPDVAFADLTVTTQSRDQADAVRNNAAKMQSVMDVLRKSEIAERDIRTQYYTVQPSYDYNANPPVLTGYQATNSVRVAIRDIAKAGLILDKAVRAGATATEGLMFDLSDKNRAQGEALVAAVANARSKADLIAGAAGVSVGRVLAIQEQGAVAPPIIRPMMRGMAMAASQPEQTTPISPDEIVISADIAATFAIDYGSR